MTNYKKWYEGVKANPVRLERLKARRRAWYRKNRDAWLKHTREYKARVKAEWDSGVRATPETRRKAEELAPKALEMHGFSSIRRMSWEFPFDYLAKFNSQVYMVEVTTAARKRLRKVESSRSNSWSARKKREDTSWRLDYDRTELADYLGARIAILFIKPSLQEYYLLVDPKFKGMFHKMTYYHKAQYHGQL